MPTPAFYVLRVATADDLPAIVAIYNQTVGVANADFSPVSVASRQAWFLAHGDTRPILVITKDEQVVAWASLSNLYDRPAYAPSVEISVYVDKDHYGQGLAKTLIKKLLTQAKSLAIKSVVALIFAHNSPSLQLFYGMGFERWGVLPAIAWSSGVLADVVMLGIKIDGY